MDDEARILGAIGVPKGDLRFCYWGLPQSAKRLTFQDCKSLIDKITARVKNWTRRNLFMPGRVQLVNGTIQGMHFY